MLVSKTKDGGSTPPGLATLDENLAELGIRAIPGDAEGRKLFALSLLYPELYSIMLEEAEKKHKRKSMGMYDYINWHSELPDGAKWKDRCLQSKSMFCSLSTYTVNEDGTMLDYQGERFPFTGDLRFYTYDKGWWCEYNAVFEKGRLKSVNAKDRWHIEKRSIHDLPSD